MSLKPLLMAFCVTSLLLLPRPAAAAQPVEQYVEWEIERIERSYALLDSFAKDVWPGWDDYLHYDIYVQFPNMVMLLVGPEKAPEGYGRIPGRLVHGRPVYLNRTKALPIVIDAPLGGGGGGGTRVIIKLKMASLTPPQIAAWKARGEREIDPDLFGVMCSDNHILVYVHELFHCYQQRLAKRADEQSEVDIAEYVPTTEEAAFAEIEGQCLKKAYLEKDPEALRRDLADWFAAYDARRARMNTACLAAETLTTVDEGTATYSNLRMAQIIIERKHMPPVRSGGDPMFFGFRGAGKYVERMLDEIADVASETFDTVGKCYDYGAYQCFLLDRVAPAWKAGFFEGHRCMADLLRDALRLTDAERNAAASRLESLHGFRQLVEKHAAPLKQGQDALALANARHGRRFVVDLTPLRELVSIHARGGSFQVGLEWVFPHGIEQAGLERFLLTSADTPFVRRGVHRLEWVETDPQPGAKGYSLECSKKRGDICENATLTTAGFVLKAPEIKVSENADGMEVVVSVLAKVPRK